LTNHFDYFRDMFPADDIRMTDQRSDLERIFKNNNKRRIDKWNHYFDIYERYLSRFRNREIAILEIGVSQGGSLQMWKEYFGGKAEIFGIDIDPRCKQFEEENIQVFIGSQSDRKFLREVKTLIPRLDILIDDGGHTMKQQIVSFEELFGHVKEDGIYLCEDLHTSYKLNWGGGYRRRRTFIEYSKNFIDYLHAHHSEQNHLKANTFTYAVNAIHYYDSVLVIEKKTREKPTREKTGELVFYGKINHSPGKKAVRELTYFFLQTVNRALRFFRFPGSSIWK
jgi:SAM-dependent methyltransferase